MGDQSDTYQIILFGRGILAYIGVTIIVVLLSKHRCQLYSYWHFWPIYASDFTKQHRCRSILVQVMACCRTAWSKLPELMSSYHQRCSVTFTRGKSHERCSWISSMACFRRLHLILNVRGPSYLGLTSSISWLLMPWLLTSPGHQQPWYWLCSICMSWSYMRGDLSTYVVSMWSNDIKCKYMFMFPLKKIGKRLKLLPHIPRASVLSWQYSNKLSYILSICVKYECFWHTLEWVKLYMADHICVITSHF